MAALSLSGRRVLITGAAGGVGREVARQMLAQGARMFLTDRNEPALAAFAAESESAMAWARGDLACADGVAGIFAELDAALGGLDILVACAGIGSDPLMAFTDESWRDVIESNLVSYVACTRAAIERIRRAERGTGSVILLGSISVHIKAVGESV